MLLHLLVTLIRELQDEKKPFFVLGVISADGKKLARKVDLKFNRCSIAMILVLHRSSPGFIFVEQWSLKNCYSEEENILFDKEDATMNKVIAAPSKKTYALEKTSIQILINIGNQLKTSTTFHSRSVVQITMIHKDVVL